MSATLALRGRMETRRGEVKTKRKKERELDYGKGRWRIVRRIVVNVAESTVKTLRKDDWN